MREQHRIQWVNAQLPKIHHITALPGDASFRRYFRVATPDHNYLLVDAPPELEDCHRFVAVARAYRAENVLTPRIFAEALKEGFLLIEDFGDVLLAQALTAENAQTLYAACYPVLPHIQRCRVTEHGPLPSFDDHFIEQELRHFERWCVQDFTGVVLGAFEKKLLTDTFQQLKENAKAQPQVGIHRDFHSRNLLVLADKSIGVIDFQDAMIGPLTYDLVSLLRDCYVAFDPEKVTTWVKHYYDTYLENKTYSYEQFQRWFDWQGLQRHLKALFIFTRKYLRDGSKNYLGDIPRTFHYVERITQSYSEFKVFHRWIVDVLKEPLYTRCQTFSLKYRTEEGA